MAIQEIMVQGNLLLNLKDTIETNLRNLGKDSTSEMLLIGNITFLLREDTDINAETIQQLEELDDPLIQALCFFLKWKLNPHEKFNEIRNFFSSLRSAMAKYSKNDDLNTKLLEIYIGKKFNSTFMMNWKMIYSVQAPIWIRHLIGNWFFYKSEF